MMCEYFIIVLFDHFTVSGSTLHSPSTGYHSKHIYWHTNVVLVSTVGFQTFSACPTYIPDLHVSFELGVSIYVAGDHIMLS